jgi:AMMECR1 domain-containing protein
MEISAEDKRRLLALARAAVAHAVGAAERPEPDAPAGVLAEPHGCFVTLTNRGA